MSGVRADMRAFQKQVTETLTNYANATNHHLTSFHNRMGNVEQATANLISTDAVALRIIFDRLGVTAEERFKAGMELDMFSELFALFHYFRRAANGDSPLLAVKEFGTIKLKLDEETKAPIQLDEDVYVRILFVAPKDYDTVDEKEADGFSLVLKKDGSCAVVDGVPTMDEGCFLASDVLVSPDRFERLFSNTLAAEVAYTEASISVTDPPGLGRFLRMIDFDTYVKATKDRLDLAQRVRDKEAELEETGHIEVDAAVLGADQGPAENTRVFG
ncbi:MAG: hypothetical protein KDB07_02965, partial [Planctomycetes bacterium]|nr:hypothetical protein [Planctomycetota bacterium]